MKSATRVLVIGASLFWLSPAQGQISLRPLDRPSDQGPSARVGQLGGRSTTSGVVSLRQRSARSLEENVSSSFMRARSGPIPDSSLAPAFMPLMPRSMAPNASFRSEYLAANFGADGRELMAISGMNWFTSDSVPIIDDLYPEILVTGTPYLPPIDERSTFSRYFDLQPYQARAIGPDHDDGRTYVDILEEESLRRMEIAKEAALEAFRQGTQGESNTEQRERLARAQSLLSGLTRIDPEFATSYLLIAHTALEREHLISASDALIQFAVLEPRFFIDGGDVREFYGDPTRIDILARRYLFTLSGVSSDPRYYVIQSYAAWLRKDWVRLRAALDTMDKANRAADVTDPRLERYRFALLAAAQAVE